MYLNLVAVSPFGTCLLLSIQSDFNYLKGFSV